MPPLPKINKTKEADFGITFRRWFEKHPMTGTFELKDIRGNKRFYLREWKERQKIFAEAIRYSTKGVLIRNRDTEGIPDYSGYFNAPSFVVINFPEGFCIISGDALALDKRKSLTFSEASDLSYLVV